MSEECPKKLAERLLDHLQQYIEDTESLINQLYEFDQYSAEEQAELIQEATELLT